MQVNGFIGCQSRQSIGNESAHFHHFCTIYNKSFGEAHNHTNPNKLCDFQCIHTLCGIISCAIVNVNIDQQLAECEVVKCKINLSYSVAVTLWAFMVVVVCSFSWNELFSILH